LMSVA
jgi:hypothetical protein